MESGSCFCIFATFLLCGGFAAGEEAAHLKRQTSNNPFQPSFIQLLQKWAALSSAKVPQDDAADLNNIMQQINQVRAPNIQGIEDRDLGMDDLVKLVNSVQQTGENRMEFQLTDEDRNDPDIPAVSVVVETLSAEDLLASEKGREQLTQLNAQLERAMNSLSQRVETMQGPDQAGEVNGRLLNVSAETMLGGLVSMLAGVEEGHLFLGMVGSQSLQAVNQLTQTLDQLPGLKNLLGKLYRFAERLHAGTPSIAKDLQQLVVNAVTSLQRLNGGSTKHGQLMEMDSMVELALGGLNANLELLEFMVNELEQIAENPNFLPAVNNTHCLVKSLRDELSTNVAAECLEQLMQTVVMMNQSNQMISALITSITHIFDNPQALQSFTDLMKMPSLDKVFGMIQMMMGDLYEANADVAHSLQTLQNMLQNLWDSRLLLETLSNLLQNPESSQIYENAMQILKDATLGDPATQQLLKVVNDSISMMWQGGNSQDTVKKLQEILSVLTSNQQITEPLSESQQALLDLLNKLLEVAQNSIHGETTVTPTPTTATSVIPIDVSTNHDVQATTTSSVATRSSLSTSAQNSFASTTTSWTTRSKMGSEGPSTLSPGATRTPDTNDDNGSVHVSPSIFNVIVALLALALSWQRAARF